MELSVVQTQDTPEFPLENQRAEQTRRIEALLESARIALGALRADEADTSLQEAERVLLTHPELPQSAWWMAEVRQLSVELSRERNPELAREQARAARALEGPRARTFNEALRAQPEPTGVTRTVSLAGLSTRDVAEWNGVERPGAAELPVGTHHLRVMRGGRAVWSGWLTIRADSTTVRIGVPKLVACSADDLAGVSLVAERAVPRADTACADFAVAREVRGRWLLARCRNGRCGAFESPLTAPPPLANPPSSIPTWAYVAGSVLVTGGLVWLAAPSSNGAAPPPRFRYEGLR